MPPKQEITVTDSNGNEVQAVATVPVTMGKLFTVEVSGVDANKGSASLNITPSSNPGVPDFFNGTLVEDGGNPHLLTARFEGVNFDDVHHDGSAFLAHGVILQNQVEIAAIDFAVQGE